MIFLFRIISDENPEFIRDLVAESSDTFLDFHTTLQKELGYDPAQLASIFLTNHQWEKEQEITLIDMMPDPGVSSFIMDQVTLGEYISQPNQRMLYVFDFFSDRTLFIEVLEMSDQVSQRPTPFISLRKGDPPPQMAVDLLMDEPEDMGDTDPMDYTDSLDSDFPYPDEPEDEMPEDEMPEDD